MENNTRDKKVEIAGDQPACTIKAACKLGADIIELILKAHKMRAESWEAIYTEGKLCRQLY